MSSGAEPAFRGLAGIRVLDFSTQIAGPYCSKLLVDAGAAVVKVEPPEGDPMRRWSATGATLGGEDSALFRYLNAGKQSVVGTAADGPVAALLAEADLVVEAHGLAHDAGERLDLGRLRAERPDVVVVSITPYGLTGPWAGRAATEFTLQAESGSLGIRGLTGGPPFQAGGRVGEWAAGTYAAAAALPAVLQARASGRGRHVDLSILETANMVFTNFSDTMNRLLNGGPGRAEHAFLAPTVETPSIEATADGWVGFCTNARRQFDDFLVLIDRPDLVGDEEMASVFGRMVRFDEWTDTVERWCGTHSTAAIVEAAARARIPVTPVGDAEAVLHHEQNVDRHVYVPDARDQFRQPRRPWRIDDHDPPPPASAPRLGEHDRTAAFANPTTRAAPAVAASAASAAAAAAAAAAARDLPLHGVRVLDLTAWFAGPAATHLLACLGAEVIHVESARRPDGMRGIGVMMGDSYEQHWEASPHFLAANANKSGLTLDLGEPAGFALLERLIPLVDVVVENFTPRVLDGFGLSWELVQRLNPRAVLVRMPAFGLTGPWRDRPGFAQTVEQFSGLAWITGLPSDQPRIPRGPCDPLAGMHAALATVVALAEREHTGRGHLVESTLAETSLSVAAEQVVEWTAYGRTMGRDGNRSPLAAPQGLYPCRPGTAPTDAWVALSVATDAQWAGLRAALGAPGWAADPEFQSADGRRARHDEIDGHLGRWTQERTAPDAAEQLRATGVPASAVVDASRVLESNPQMRARGYFESPDHPVVGKMPLPALPFRYSDVAEWLRTPAPTLGRDNEQVLADLLGLSDEQLRELDEATVIGRRPAPRSA